MGQAPAQYLSNHFVSEDVREQEILQTWYWYFEEWEMNNPPPRRTKHLRQYAKYIIKWVDYYENNEGKFGGRLPPYKDNHLLVATMIRYETGINPNKVGKLGEVGLMQVWGDAMTEKKPLNRIEYKKLKKEVINNPELGIRLGIQWLAYSTTRCRPPKVWNATGWLKSLTQYGGGSKAGSGSKCKIYRFARKRIRKVMKYRRKIDKAKLTSI
jgi:soluble lytic murein transglycosylase-like protein